MGRQHGRCPVTGRPGVELLGASENQSPHALVRPGETQGTETEPDRPASQALREHKRLRQHPRNIGFGWLALDRFTADGARRAASAPGHKEAMPTTTIRPSAGSGILIHNFLPHSLRRLGPEPHPPVEKNGYFSSSKTQPLTARTLHHRTDRLRDGDPLRGRVSGG